MLEVVNRLQKHGYKTYLVGGSVRDMVLKREIKDFDVFTTAPIKAVKEIFSDAKILDLKEDEITILLIHHGIHYEISTFRSDIHDIKHDLTLRDFTMNSLLYDGEIHDYLHGLDDIENKLIRVNDPQRLVEDPLRILRALRFVSTLGFTIEKKTEKNLFEYKHLLENVAAERIDKELRLLLMGKHVSKVMKQYVDILSVLIPELKKMENFNQHNPYHDFDLLTHTIKVIEHTPYDASLRLAALFHDFGKLDTFTIDDEGIGHFYGHEKISAGVAKDTLKKFKVDNKTSKEVYDLVYLHGRNIHPTPKAIRRLILQIEEDMFFKLMDLKKADRLGKKKKPTSTEDLDEIIKIYQTLKEEAKLLSLKTLNLNGKDLINLGFKEGKQIGVILNDVLEKCLDDALENKHETLKGYVMAKYKP